MRDNRLLPLNWIQWLTLVLVLVFSVVSVVLFVKIQNDETIVRGILCESKADNQRNLRSSVKFLREHPNGSADFSKAFILNAIQQDRQKVQNLAALSCNP